MIGLVARLRPVSGGTFTGGHRAIPSRRGGRVVECTALEMRRGCKLTVGSNPTLSATFCMPSHDPAARQFGRWFSARGLPSNDGAIG